MEKKLNGFNNDRDTIDGVGGKESLEEKMTEQEFIAKFKEQGFELYKTEDLKPKLDAYEKYVAGEQNVKLTTDETFA